MDDEPIPEDISEAVDMYFDVMSQDEWYTIKHAQVNLPDPPPEQPKLPEEGVVDLTATECEAIRVALCSYHARNEVADEMGISREEAAEIMLKTYDKMED